MAARRRGERLRQERQESGGSGRVLLLRLAEGSAQKRWLKAYGRRAAPSRGESSGWSGFIRGSRARALQTMSCVWRVACTERRGLADIVVDVVRRPSGARGCHQIGAAVHQRYRARYVWPRCSPAGGGHSDLYMYKRETMILREDFRIRGYRGFTGGHSGTGARSEGSGRRGRWRATRWSVTTAARLLESRTAGCGLHGGIRQRRGEARQGGAEQTPPVTAKALALSWGGRAEPRSR